METKMRASTWKFFIAFLVASLVFPVQSLAGTYAKTKYPILLVHGLLGFDSIGGVEYFYNIPETLRANGATVFVDSVSAANSTRQILAATGAQKINLIGHSHGGPTIRYVAAVAPNLVASVTSVDGVNKGSAVADVLLGVAPPGSISNSILVAATNGLASLIEFLNGTPTLPQNALAAAQSLSTAGSLAFNQLYPQGVPTSACGNGDAQVNGVYYFSWTGRAQATNFFDISDPFMELTSLAFGGVPNDGLVSTCSAHLGTVISDSYPQNHLDAVNQFVGLVDIFATNPVTLYENQANRLKGLGL
jgi:triacylglycerol lipase